MTMKKLKKTKTNIEHAKPVFAKGLTVNSLLSDIPTSTKQKAGRKGGCRLP